MIGDQCHQREATVYYTQIINGQKTEMHLCRECAQKARMMMSPFRTPALWNDDFFKNMMGLDQAVDGASGQSCRSCGTAYDQFRRVGLLGCPSCYEAFRDSLRPLFDRVHGSHVHKGKHPEEEPGNAVKSPHILKLKQELKEKITDENYEEAARIRDEIKREEKGGEDDQS